MQIKNTTYYTDLDFADYLSMPGVSFSSLKEFQGPPNTGMSLGTQVHNYLLEPEKYSWENVQEVKAIATQIREILGPALDYLKKEVAFTAEFHHNGVMMLYKGRADLIYTPRIVIDLKVLSGSLKAAVEFFGYDKQVGGYCLGTQCAKGLILAYNRTKKIVEKKWIDPQAVKSFWEYTTVQRCQIA